MSEDKDKMHLAELEQDILGEKLRPVIANYESIIKHKDARIKELEEKLNNEKEETINYIANVASMISGASATGGCEFAGLCISVLAKHTDIIEPFFDRSKNPIIYDERFNHEHGCLTFYNKKNEVVAPEKLKVSRTVNALLKMTPPTREGGKE